MCDNPLNASYLCALKITQLKRADNSINCDNSINFDREREREMVKQNYRNSEFIIYVYIYVARCYLWLFALYINIKMGKNSCLRNNFSLPVNYR